MKIILDRSYLSRAYRLALSQEKKRQFQLKVLAEGFFKGKKKNYNWSIGNWFIDDRVPKEHQTQIKNFVTTNLSKESLKYSSPVVKYDRSGYKKRDRYFLLSDKAVYIMDTKSFKLKHRLPLDKISFYVSDETDNVLIVQIPLELKKDKGDLIVAVPEIIELCVWILEVTKRNQIIKIFDSGS